MGSFICHELLIGIDWKKAICWEEGLLEEEISAYMIRNTISTHFISSVRVRVRVEVQLCYLLLFCVNLPSGCSVQSTNNVTL